MLRSYSFETPYLYVERKQTGSMVSKNIFADSAVKVQLESE